MGINETVIHYNRYNAAEATAYLKNVEFKFILILKSLQKGFSVTSIAFLLDTDKRVIKEFKKKNKQKIEVELTNEFKKLEKKIHNGRYDVAALKLDLIQLLLLFKFSKSTISKILDCPSETIKKNKMEKKQLKIV